MIGSSNFMIPIRIESTDRRHALFATSNEKRGDINYFSKLAQSCTQENADIFFSYLTYKKTPDNFSLRKIPMTEMREKLLQSSLPSSLLFLRENKSSLSGRLTATELYNMYIHYCDITGEKRKTMRGFGMDISNNISKIKSNGRVTYDMDSICNL